MNMLKHLKTIMPAKKKSAKKPATKPIAQKTKKKVALKKKVAKKGVVKKTGTKKKVSSKNTLRKKVASKSKSATKKKAVAKKKRKQLVHAGEDVSFWVYEGPVLRNLLELYDALEAISDEQFYHHVRSEADNDFANWVEEVLCDGDCAGSLKTAHDREGARDVVQTRLKIYYI